jgi:2-polyprenyl-6-hydroxyphenyl methylase/3-demethylubiquinone-9 3-methyltransferase
MNTPHDNIDKAEIDKFDALAARWWDPEGDFRPLHQINPLRLDYIRQRVTLDGLRVLDVGCGGGILAEAMAAKGSTWQKSHWASPGSTRWNQAAT